MFTNEELNAAFAHMRARRWHSSYDARLNDGYLQVYAEYHGWYNIRKEEGKMVMLGDYPGADSYYDSLEETLEEAMDAIYRKCEEYRKRRFFENALEGLPKQLFSHNVEYGGFAWVRLRRGQALVIYYIAVEKKDGFEEYRVMVHDLWTDAMRCSEPGSFEDAVVRLMEVLGRKWANLIL